MVYVQEEVNVLTHSLTHSLTDSLIHSLIPSFLRSFIHSFTADTILSIDDCRIEQNGNRGVYAYHNCTLYMKDSVVTGTESKELAAIDVWSCSGDMSCRITPPNAPLTDESLNEYAYDQPNNTHTTCNDGSEFDELPSRHIDRMIAGTNPVPSACTFLSTQLGTSSSTPLPIDFKSIKSSIHLTGQLSIYLSNCTINNNNGIGIRMINEKAEGLSGIIDNCSCYDNMKGNYITFQHNFPATTNTSTTAMIAAEEIIDNNDSQPSKTQQELSFIYIWEYERDDPLNTMEHGWKAYDTIVMCFLEQQWHLYLQRKQSTKETTLDCLDAVDDEDYDENNIPTLHSFSLCSPYDKYFIDFETMIQTNSETHYTRRIHRRLQVL